jgi:hypothetical protein
MVGLPTQVDVDHYKNCFTAEEMGVADNYRAEQCIVLKVTSGEIKLGSKIAAIPEIEVANMVFALDNYTPFRTFNASNVAGGKLVTSQTANFTPDLVGYQLHMHGNGYTIAHVIDSKNVMVSSDIHWASPPGGHEVGLLLPARVILNPPATPPKEIFLSGGLLGIPALDPILRLENTNFRLLSLGATPVMGAVDPGTSGIEFWIGAGGGTSQGHHTLQLPLTVNLNNLLLGSKSCRIPEMTLRPTTGTATVPAGVTPMTGSLGGGMQDYWVDNLEDPYASSYVLSHGYVKNAKFVDNGFAISGVTGCDGPLKLGKVLGILTGTNPIEKLVNQQAGLPSPAGRNHVILNVEGYAASYYNPEFPTGQALAGYPGPFAP